MTVSVTFNRHFVLLFSTLTFVLCDDQPEHWACLTYGTGNCYKGGPFMTQPEAQQYCIQHNMISGIHPSDYETLKKVPSAWNDTWLGIQQHPQDEWQYLSGGSVPGVMLPDSGGCGYQLASVLYCSDCSVDKKYVCGHKNTQNGEKNYTVFNSKRSWHQARTNCIKFGGDLYDPNVYNWRIFSNAEHFWIGVHKDLWVWTATSQQVKSTDWAYAQPSGHGGCVSFDRLDGWYVRDCTQTAQALCVEGKDIPTESTTSSTHTSLTSTTTSTTSTTTTTTTTSPTTTLASTTEQSSTKSPESTTEQSSTKSPESTTEQSSTKSNESNSNVQTASSAAPGVTRDQMSTSKPGVGDIGNGENEEVDMGNGGNSSKGEDAAVTNSDEDDRYKIVGGALGGVLALIIVSTIVVLVI